MLPGDLDDEGAPTALAVPAAEDGDAEEAGGASLYGDLNLVKIRVDRGSSARIRAVLLGFGGWEVRYAPCSPQHKPKTAVPCQWCSRSNNNPQTSLHFVFAFLITGSVLPTCG